METSASILSVKSGNDALTEVAAEGICDLRRDVAKAEADIKSDLHTGFCDTLKAVGDAECAIIKNDADNAHRSTIQLNSVERDLQNRILENRAILSQRISDKSDRILDRVSGFERSMDEKLCGIKAQVLESERRILDRLSADKLDEKNEVIDSLRHDRYHDRFANQFALQNQELNYLKQMINSVEQTQRFSSKTVQFGAGNVAIPTQTANQG